MPTYRTLLPVRIQACALGAVIRFDFAGLGGFGTAITAIVFAAAVVVIVVTVAIAFVLSSSTSPFAALGILALALLAVIRFDFAALNG